MDKRACCGTCYWYGGKVGDGYQFCDELETDVSEQWYCKRYKESEDN